MAHKAKRDTKNNYRDERVHDIVDHFYPHEKREGEEEVWSLDVSLFYPIVPFVWFVFFFNPILLLPPHVVSIAQEHNPLYRRGATKNATEAHSASGRIA